MKKIGQLLKRLSIVQKGLLLFAALFAIGIAGNVVSPNNQNTSTKHPITSKALVQPEKKTVTDTQVIPFSSTTTNSSSLPKGQSKVTTAGVNGSKTLTYEITYRNGKEIGRKLVKTEVTLQPVTQVTTIGTYVAPPQPSCPNGSYVNSAGSTICSPSSSSAGATAQCADGSYSYSQSRSGTCSHHGGVSTWY